MKFGSFASLRDALVGREIACRVPECDRTWLWSKEEIAQAQQQGGGAGHPPARMCASCSAFAAKAEDRAVPCARDGCTGTWSWSRTLQLDAWIRARRPEAPLKPPERACSECSAALAKMEDQAVACRLRGCKNPWTWSAESRAQAAAETGQLAPAPPKRLCAECEEALRKLEDRAAPCRVRGCPRTFVWTRWSQLEAWRAGKGGEGPPSRMCDHCVARAQALTEQEVPCRVTGCENRVVLSSRALLEAEIAGETGIPKRMCATCLERFGQLEDQTLPCKRRGCKNTWVWKRGAQLASKRKRPPPRFCDACEKALEGLADRQVPCEHAGCKGTWTWHRAAQLQPGAKRPPKKACEACTQFLATAQAKEIPCARCGKVIHWPKVNQIQTKLGRWVEPTLCGACKQISKN